jgi:PTH1 family peptidyl-tRNA hydrolase
LPRRAVIGLGNPGARYARTRHNAGFLVVELVARAHGASAWERRAGALCTEARIGDTRLLLVKPQEYMNRSGSSVAILAQEEGLAPADLLVVHDDLDLVLARLKLKRGGGTAGHRGLESIVEHLGSRDFARLRVGIGRPPAGQEVADFVLTAFATGEEEPLAAALAAATRAVGAWVELAFDAAMNVVNAPPPPAAEPPSS